MIKKFAQLSPDNTVLCFFGQEEFDRNAEFHPQIKQIEVTGLDVTEGDTIDPDSLVARQTEAVTATEVPEVVPPPAHAVSDLTAISKTDFLDALLLPEEQDALLDAQIKVNAAATDTAIASTDAEKTVRRLLFRFGDATTIDLTDAAVKAVLTAIAPLLIGPWRANQILAGHSPTATDPSA